MSTYAGERLREEVKALQAQLAEARQQAGSTPPVALPAALTPTAAESVPDAVAPESDSAPAQAALAVETAKSPLGSPVATADAATADAATADAATAAAATATPAAATAAPPTATGRLPSQI